MPIPTRTKAATANLKRFPIQAVFDETDSNPVFEIREENGVTEGVVLNVAALLDADGKIDLATSLAANSVLKGMLAGGFLQVLSVAGQDETMDATYDVTGVAVGDQVAAVLRLNTAAAIATASFLAAADFSVTAADVITRGANAEDNTNDQMIFFIIDLT